MKSTNSVVYFTAEVYIFVLLENILDFKFAILPAKEGAIEYPM